MYIIFEKKDLVRINKMKYHKLIPNLIRSKVEYILFHQALPGKDMEKNYRAWGFVICWASQCT